MSQTTEQQSPQPRPSTATYQPGIHPGLLFALLLGLVAVAMFLGRRKYKGDKLDDGARWANPKELTAARRKAIKQMAQQKRPKCALRLDKDYKIVIPNAQQSIAFIGGSGYGKTESGVSRCISDAFRQGMPSIIYDIKGDLMRLHAVEAISRGYKVYFFAPGKHYTDGLNFLDFLRDEDDAGMALQLAQVLNANFQPPGSKSDNYFGPNGDSALKAAFMWAKGIDFYPDLIQAFEILRLRNFAHRLEFARSSPTSNYWAINAAASLIAAMDSPETIGSIVSTAVTYFARMMDPDIIPCLTMTTMPLDLTERTVIFVQPDEQRMAATAPLCAAAIHMLVERNLNAESNRKNPFLICVDEFPTLRLTELSNWINLKRSYWQILLLTYQSTAQIVDRYGKPTAEAIEASIGTSFSFNPGKRNLYIAEQLSKACGMKRIRVENHSKSYGRNGSPSVSIQLQREPLMPPEKITAFKEGEVIIQSPVLPYPYHVQLPLDLKAQAQEKVYAQKWDTQLRPKLEARYKQRMPAIYSLKEECSDRQFFAQSALPHPEQPAAQQPQPNKQEVKT